MEYRTSTRQMGVAEESYKPFSVRNLPLEDDYLVFLLPYGISVLRQILVLKSHVRFMVGQLAN